MVGQINQSTWRTSKGSLTMNTFRNKQFKNQLDPKYAFYDCLRSCELKSSSENSLEECVEKCDLDSTKKNPNK